MSNYRWPLSPKERELRAYRRMVREDKQIILAYWLLVAVVFSLLHLFGVLS